jgi:thioredoxin 1
MPQVFDTPLNSNDQSLDRVLKAGLPVALVFVDGAGALDDTLERLARAQAGKLLVVKVKAAENPASARRFGVRATPAVVAVRDGQAVSQAEGVSPAEVEHHARYLLGQGPRPEPRPQPQTAAPGPAPQPGRAGGGQPVIVTDADFEQQVLRSPEPVLIDFWAPWCGPCRMVAPTVDKLAREMAGRLRVAKVNVDENPGLSMRYGVQSIPTMMIFRGGQLVDRWMGALPEPGIRQRLSKTLGL